MSRPIVYWRYRMIMMFQQKKIRRRDLKLYIIGIHLLHLARSTSSFVTPFNFRFQKLLKQKRILLHRKYKPSVYYINSISKLCTLLQILVSSRYSKYIWIVDSFRLFLTLIIIFCNKLVCS